MAENVILDKQIVEKAKNISCKIDNENLRKRTYALNIAADATSEYLKSKGFSVSTKNSLYKVPSLAQNIEIADIYVNNVRLDVRVTFDENIFYIPKVQEKFDAVPCAYIITQLDSNLDELKILGFVSSEKLEKQNNAKEYYCYESSVLSPMSELKSFVFGAKPDNNVPSPDEIEKIKELAVSFVDDTISESEKVYFIKNVLKYAACREILSDMNDFNKLAVQITNYGELLNDSTLSILSGNKEEVDGAILAGMATLVNEEETIETLDLEELPESQDEPVQEEVLTESDSVEDDLISLEEVESEETPTLEFNEEDTLPEAIDDLPTEEIGEEEIIKPMSLLVEEQSSLENDITETSEESLDEPESLTLEEIEENTEEDEFKLQFEEDEFSEFSSSEETVTEPELVEEEIVEDLNLEEDTITNLETTEELQEFDILEEEISETPDNESTNITSLDLSESHEETDALVEDDSESLLLSDDDSDDMLLEEFEEEKTEPAKVEAEPVAERKPFSLSLEGEDETKTEEEEPVYSSQEPVEMVYEEDNEDTDTEDLSALSELDELSEMGDEEESSQENGLADNDEKIKEFLDDDLLAILSNNEEKQASPLEEAPVQNVSQEEENNNEEQFILKMKESDAPVEEKLESEVEADVVNNEESIQESESIKTLFKENEKTENGEEKPFELAKEPVSEKTASAAKNIIIGLALLLFLAGGSIAAWFVNQAKTADNDADIANQDSGMFDLQNNAVKPDNNDQEPALSQDINKSMTNSFSDKPAAITITKLSWQVSEKLASENSVKEYLQTAGKNIQINLQNDLTKAADINFNNSIKLSMEIAPDNTMKGMQILESSGSDIIDDMTLRSIKNTLKYVSVPKLKDNTSDYFLTLIINF